MVRVHGGFIALVVLSGCATEGASNASGNKHDESDDALAQLPAQTALTESCVDSLSAMMASPSHLDDEFRQWITLDERQNLDGRYAALAVEYFAARYPASILEMEVDTTLLNGSEIVRVAGGSHLIDYYFGEEDGLVALYDHSDHQSGRAEWFCGGSSESSLKVPSERCLTNLFKSTIPSARPAAVSATIDAAGGVVADPIIQIAVDWYRNVVQGRSGEAMTMEVFRNPYGRSARIEFPLYEAELFVMEMHGHAPMAVFSKTEASSSIQCE